MSGCRKCRSLRKVHYSLVICINIYIYMLFKQVKAKLCDPIKKIEKFAKLETLHC